MRIAQESQHNYCNFRGRWEEGGWGGGGGGAKVLACLRIRQHKITKTFAMVDDVRKVNASISCGNGDYRWSEHALLLLFFFFYLIFLFFLVH